MNLEINPMYPSIGHLKARAKSRIPRFAFEYLDGGCNNEINLKRNTEDIRNIKLQPYYLRDYSGIDLQTTLFGHTYSAPFGISPIGLQGLMWPGASEILAKTAFEQNIPYILSTVGTASIEKIAEITQGQAWFQLYHPAEDKLRDDMIDRLLASGIKVLVVLADVPSFGYRPKEIKNGLAIPPKMTFSNMVQIASKTNWAISTLLHGQPEFKTLKPYLPKGLNLKHLGLFMNKTFDGRLSHDRIKVIRDKWPHKLVIKGIANVEDAQKSIDWGMDGIIVSNHGGRQLDAGESAITSLQHILTQMDKKITVMMDSGIRDGTDIANTLACGADFTFLGRSFMYGVSAMGKKGGDQVFAILRKELQQVMQQLCCPNTTQLYNHRIKS
ncbi:MAG: alpha-hydroxy-acid oxidizing protein [Saprospiraceae bacterium]|nr:alpha-hydroxy-acid oxidizing protein [Saprospiraceae bacterium]